MFVCLSCAFVTWLKGDFAEHHPEIGKVKAAAEEFGCAAVQWHGDVAGAWVPIVQHRLERHRLRLPVDDEAGLKPAGNGGEDLHTAAEHVVTVNLEQGEITFIRKCDRQNFTYMVEAVYEYVHKLCIYY